MVHYAIGRYRLYINFFTQMYFGANLYEYIWMKTYGNSSYAYGCVRKSGQGHQLIYFNFLNISLILLSFKKIKSLNYYITLG